MEGNYLISFSSFLHIALGSLTVFYNKQRIPNTCRCSTNIGCDILFLSSGLLYTFREQTSKASKFVETNLTLLNCLCSELSKQAFGMFCKDLIDKNSCSLEIYTKSVRRCLRE